MLADITGLNSEQRISDFWEMLKGEHVYRVPLCYFCDIGKINFPLKIDFKIKCHLKTDMKKLFKTNKQTNKKNCDRCSRCKNYFYKGYFISVQTIFTEQKF